MDREDEKEFVALANEIIQKCNLNIKVDKLTDCNDAFFVLLYKGLIGDNLKGLIAYPVYRDEHIHNCKCVIESLANEVLNVDLSHIKANGIVDGDFMSITNLLEIFSGLLEYFMECIDENQSDSEDDLDDSNIITSQHQVISSLLKEEFGTSHQGDSKPEKSTQSTTKQTSSSEKPMSFLYSSANQITSGLQITEQPSMRFSSTFGLSGHEADSSEVSDSTNELIRLGESSGSGHSSTRITGPVRSAWKPSISDTINQQELTQYTISSDEGDSFQSHLNNKNKSSDHLSSSVISSTSSYRQQISPLDADHGIKLDSIGLRPKVDNITAPGKDSSEDGSSSGRSTPILHHHYHHHYHHPPELNTSRTGNMSSQYDNIQDYRTIPGNIKNAIQVGSTHHARAILLGSDVDGISKVTGYIPGQSASEGLAGRPRGISDYTSSVAGLSGNGIAKYTRDTVSGVPGQGIDNNGIGLAGESLSTGPSTGLPDYKAASVSGLQGKERSNLPFTEYSRVGMQGQSVSTGLSTGLPDYKTMSVPGLSGKERSNIPLTDYSGLIRQTQPSSLSISLADYKSTTRFSPPEKDHGHTAIETGPGYSRSVSGTTSLNSTRYLMQQNHSVSRPSELNTTGQSTSIHSSTIPEQRIPGSKFLSDHSRLRTSGHGELRAVSGVASSIPVTHSTSQSGLAGSLHDTSLASVPGSSSLRDQYLSRVLPLTTTTSLPSSSGLLTVSSGGYSDVFTNTDRMPGMPSNKSMDPKKIRDQQEPHQRTISQNTNLISTATGKDNKQTGPSKDDTKPEDVRHDNDDESDGDSDDDDDDDDDARYSDSAVDYHRGGAQVDSDNESGESSVLQRIHDRWQKLKSGQPSKPSARRAVTFNEDIETIPITSRMERLRRLLEEEADEQRQHTEAIRDVYAEQLQELQKQQHQERKDMGKRKVQKSPLVSKKKAKKPVPSKQRGRLEAIYRPQGRVGRPSKRPLAKARKRSASASPVVRRRKKTSIADCQESLLPSLFDEFPFLHVSPQTTHAMWQKQAKQISLLSKSETTALKSKSQRRVEEAEKRQERLLKILRKELEYNQRVRNEQERQDHQRTIKAKVNEKRQVAARARRYYDEYQLRMRSKMLKRRTREEQILKKLFDDGLEIQKQRVRELRKYAKEKTEAIEQQQTNQIQSLENYYKDQFSMLAENMTRERHDLKVRQEAQEKVMRQMRREMRKKMEKEIENLQETLTRDEDSAYFRQLEADRLRREFQLAMYKSDL